jgi:hypothetical protein
MNVNSNIQKIKDELVGVPALIQQRIHSLSEDLLSTVSDTNKRIQSLNSDFLFMQESMDVPSQMDQAKKDFQELIENFSQKSKEENSNLCKQLDDQKSNYTLLVTQQDELKGVCDLEIKKLSGSIIM